MEIIDTKKSERDRSERTSNTNRLIAEKSPYLLQHAYNPVEWYPWGVEAFERAKSEDKPIFLSIEYRNKRLFDMAEQNNSIQLLLPSSILIFDFYFIDLRVKSIKV